MTQVTLPTTPGFGAKAGAHLRTLLLILGNAVPHTAIVTACLAMGVAAALLVFFAYPHQGFVRELTAGGAILADDNKLRGVRTVYLAIALLPLSVVVAWILVRRLGPVRIAPPTAQRLGLLLAVPLALAGGGLAGAAALGLAPGLAIYLLLLAGGGLLHLAFGARSGPAIATAFALAAAFAWHGGHAGWLAIPIALPTGFLAACILMIALRRHDTILKGLFALASLALVLATARTAPLLWPHGTSSGALVRVDVLVLGVCLAVGGTTAAWLIRGRGRPFAQTPAVVLALALALMNTLAYDTTTVSLDDYHFGERLLAGQTLGSGRLFSSFFTAHGLTDALGALGDPTVSGDIIGRTYSVFLLMLLCGWLLTRRCGPLVAILLLCAVSMTLRTTAPLLVVLALVAISAIRSDVLFGAAIAAGVAAGTFFLNGVGVAVSLAGALMATVLFRSPSRAGLGRIAAGAGAASAVIFAVFWPQVTGELFFLKVSSDANLFVYGNNGMPSNFGAALAAGGGTALLFAAMPTMGLLLVLRPDTPFTARSFLRLALSVLPLVAFAVTITPYALARIDLNLIRGQIATTIALPILAIWLEAPRLRMWFPHLDRTTVRAAQIALGALTVVAAGLSPPWMTAWLVAPRLPPVVRMDAIPIYGTARPSAAHQAEIDGIRAVAQSVLKPGETFVDVTNRNALYFYLGQQPPAALSSVYNAAPRAFQERFVSDLRAHPATLAIVDANTIEHDGLSLGARAFGIYRYLLENYVPFERGPFLYAIRREAADRVTAPRELADVRELWARAFHRDHLLHLPSAWGRSLPLLTSQLRPGWIALAPASGEILRPQGAEGPTVSVQDFVLPAGTRPADHGLLAFRVGCADAGRRPSHVRVYWRAADEPYAPARSMAFDVSGRDALVPLDISPRWFLAPSVAELRIDAHAPGCARPIVDGVRLTGRT